MTPQPQVRAVRRVESAARPGVELELFVPASLDFFPDHFPRLGILPGVVQIDWAITLGRAHLAIDGEFRGVRALKFINPILPDTALTLALAQATPGELTFNYRADARAFSSGRVLFGAQLGSEPA
jgi:3-hydroxymyristoyl/3-hydroxydecanoyl-(acyl carrier protein) dehydratase